MFYHYFRGNKKLSTNKNSTYESIFRADRRRLHGPSSRHQYVMKPSTVGLWWRLMLWRVESLWNVLELFSVVNSNKLLVSVRTPFGTVHINRLLLWKKKMLKTKTVACTISARGEQSAWWDIEINRLKIFKCSSSWKIIISFKYYKH